MKVLIATSNRGKVNELARALEGTGIEPVGLDALEGRALPAPEETGATYEENALLKARYYHEASGLITIADDSGIEVDAFGGRPGVASARYGGPGLSDAERTQRLLGELGSNPVRSARFRCVLALVAPWGEEASGLSAFIRDERGGVFHTYSSFGRGGEALLPAYALLDMTPLGRREPAQGAKMTSWVRRHDEYAPAPQAAPHACCHGG